MSPPSKRKICSSFSFLMLSIFHLYTSAASTDTISTVQSLSGSTTIVSKEGNFELGFFSPGNTGNLYVGIWFRTTSKKAVTWVANRDSPVTSSTSPELKISEDGNLVLLNKFGEPKWSSNATWKKPRKSTVAVLLSNGNLILRDKGNYSDVIWQSFDHPTDTILSGQGFGMDKITGEYQNRVSWKDPEDPAPGPFSNHVDLVRLNQYVSLWNQSEVYWQSGNWTGQAFTSVPGMPLNTEYNYVFINNSHQFKFIYTTKDVSKITRIVLNVNGQLQRHTWSNESEEWIVQWSLPASLCDVYSVCGPFGVCRTGSDEKCYCLPGFRPVSSRSWDLGAWNQGCVRRTDISCVDSNIHNVQQENHAFLKIANIKVSGNPIQLNAQSTEECKSICLNNCTCTAYAYQRECIVWNSELWDLKQLSDGNIDGIDIYVRLAASDLQGQDNENKIHHARPMLIAVLGSIFVTLCVFGAVVWTFQKRNANQKAFSSDDPLILYSYSLLQNCTKNFSDKLGQGSFGSVYKGSLPNSQLIAVKKLQGMRQGEKQFQTEVRALGQIHHRNLVRLKGFCLRGAERLLVYELIAKGSLDSHLFNDVKVLDWYTRFHVILGIAKGLHYLHEECHECIIHCDIKPENILVDEDFSPKVADFGLAKLMDRNFSRALTTVRGTIGYLAPEWIAGLPITSKADVYS